MPTNDGLNGLHASDDERLDRLHAKEEARLSALGTITIPADAPGGDRPNAVRLERAAARDEQLIHNFKATEEGRLELNLADEDKRLRPSEQPPPAVDVATKAPKATVNFASDEEPTAAAREREVASKAAANVPGVAKGNVPKDASRRNAAEADAQARSEVRARAIAEKEAEKMAATTEETVQQKAAAGAAKAQVAADKIAATKEAERLKVAADKAADNAHARVEDAARVEAGENVRVWAGREARDPAAEVNVPVAAAADATALAVSLVIDKGHAQTSNSVGAYVALMACVKCRRSIPEHVFFCGFCGAISLPPNLYKNATTAHEGALPSSSYKPWRDAPKSVALTKKHTQSVKRKKGKVKASTSNYSLSEVASASSASAAASSTRPRAAVEVYSPNVIVIDGMTYVKLMPAGPVKAKALPSESAALDGSVDHDVDDGTGNSGDGNAGAADRGPELERAAPTKPELPSSGQRTPVEATVNSQPPPTAQQLIKSIKNVVAAHLKPALQERVFPLAAFEAAWLRTNERTYAVHLSLVERKLASRSQFWLRVGVVATKAQTQRTPRSPVSSIFSGKEEDAADDEEEDLQVVGWLTNDVGRRLLPPGQDWVDLDSITPKEHYILTYLQRVLGHIADRVQWDTAERSLVASRRYVDQFCLVRAGKAAKPTSSRFVRIEMVEEEYDVERLQHLIGAYIPPVALAMESPGDAATAVAQAVVPVTAVAVDDDEVDDDDVTAKPASAPAAAPAAALVLDDAVAQVTYRIPLGRQAGAPRVISTVRFSVVYYGCCPLRELPAEAEKGLGDFPSPGSRRDEDGDFVTPTPVPAVSKAMAGFGVSKFEGSEVLLARPQILHTPKATHVRLFITPSYAPVHIGQKMLIFDVATLPYLVGPTDIDAVLTQKQDVLNDFVRSLCGVLRYEYFDADAVKIVVVGATTLPEALYRPRAEPVEEEEDAPVPEVIPPVVPAPLDDDGDAERDAAAAAAAATMAADKAATCVQTLARGVSSRNRVRLLREQAQAQQVPPKVPTEPHEDGDSDATAPVEDLAPAPDPLPEPPPAPAHDTTALEVNTAIKGTELHISGEFIPDSMYGDGAKNLSLQLTATDVQEGLRTTVSVGASHVLLVARKLYGENEEFKGLVVTPTPALDATADAGGGGEWAQFGAHFPAALAADAALQRLIFHAVCDKLDLFLSRKNNVMTVKYVV